MKNLDISIANQGILDESFSNFTSDDVISLIAKIKETEDKIAFYDRMPRVPEYIILRKKAVEYLASLKSQLSSVPKSIIDAVDKNLQLQSDLSKAEAEKNQAADIAALETKNQMIQSAIDKAKGISSILDNKSKGNTSTLPVNSDNKISEPEKNNFFTTKNIIIGISVLAIAVGGFFFVKKIIKK